MKEESIPATRRSRNRAVTCQAILNAFGRLLVEEGLDGLGVNRVAELAGVSKVLIYRYFGGLNGLAAHYVQQIRLFPKALSPVETQLGSDKNLARLSCWHLLSTYHLIRQQPQAFELIKALVTEGSELADTTSRALEDEMAQFAERFHLHAPVDSQAVAAVLMSAMTHLTLLSKTSRTVAGVDLTNERGWHRIETAIAAIFEGLYSLPAVENNRSDLKHASLAA